MKTIQSSKFLLLFLISLFLGSCERSSETAGKTAAELETQSLSINEDQRLAVFFEEIFERDVDLSPEYQAYLGRKTEDYGKWDDYSEAYAETRIQLVASDLKRLQQEFDFSALNDNSKISYRIFEYRQQQTLRNFEWRYHQYAISQMNDISSTLTTFLQNIHKIENINEAEDYISRLEGIQTVLHEVIARLRKGESLGVIPPMMVYPKI